jgi:hypothetical protein
MGTPVTPAPLVGVPQRWLMGLPVLPGPQSALGFLPVQPSFTRQPGQHVDPADVLPLDKESLQDPVVVFVALAVFNGVLVALEGQVGVRLRVHLGQADQHAHLPGDGVDGLRPRPLEVIAFGTQRRVRVSSVLAHASRLPTKTGW